MYVYKETERWQDKGYTHILYTVGYYEPDGKWIPESDYEDREEAAKRVAWLNGSTETNPHLLSGDELKRTEEKRKAG